MFRLSFIKAWRTSSNPSRVSSSSSAIMAPVTPGTTGKVSQVYWSNIATADVDRRQGTLNPKLALCIFPGHFVILHLYVSTCLRNSSRLLVLTTVRRGFCLRRKNSLALLGSHHSYRLIAPRCTQFALPNCFRYHEGAKHPIAICVFCMCSSRLTLRRNTHAYLYRELISFGHQSRYVAHMTST